MIKGAAAYVIRHGAAAKLTLSRETGHSLCKTSPESAQTAGGSAAEKRTSDASLIIIHQKKDVCQYRRRRIFPFGESGDVFSVCKARAAGRSAFRIITPRTAHRRCEVPHPQARIQHMQKAHRRCGGASFPRRKNQPPSGAVCILSREFRDGRIWRAHRQK